MVLENSPNKFSGVKTNLEHSKVGILLISNWQLSQNLSHTLHVKEKREDIVREVCDEFLRTASVNALLAVAFNALYGFRITAVVHIVIENL